MNRRMNKIILDILNGKKNTIHKYAQLYNVSEQTIRNDINEMNQQFMDENHGKLNVDENGLLTITPHQDWTGLFKRYASFQHYRLSQNERRTILALLLLTSSDYTTTYDLSEYVLVSRNTLLNDIEELKLWFLKNDLELHSQAGKGYQVRGEEVVIRNGMLKLVLLNGLVTSEYIFGNENNIFENLLLDIIDKEGIYQEIKLLLIEAENESFLQLSDFSYQDTVCYLLIVIERLKNKQMLKKVVQSEQREILLNSSKYSFAQKIFNKIKKKFSVAVSTEEILYLTGMLRQKSYLKNNGHKIDSIEIQILINEFILSISNKLKIKYYLNSELFDLLENHLKLSILRIKENTLVENEMLPEIIQSYQNVFRIVRSSLKNLENYLEKQFSDDEVSFIVMYVMAIVENNINDQAIIKVKLVCNSGRGTAQLLKTKINAIFPQISIVSVASSHILSASSYDSYDLVISTVAINNLDKPLVVVNPILTEINIMDIQRAIYKIQVELKAQDYQITPLNFQKDKFYEDYLHVIEKYIDTEAKHEVLDELKKLYYTYFGVENKLSKNKEINKLSDILSVNRIKLDVSVSNWGEAVTVAGELLYNDQLIKEAYIQAMIKIIDNLNSYVVIYPGVAIPHADASDGALKTGASLVRLQNAINFNHQENDPVEFVIAFSVATEDSLGSCLYNLTEILAKGKFVNELKQCLTEEDVLTVLKKLENEVMGLSDEKISI